MRKVGKKERYCEREIGRQDKARKREGERGWGEERERKERRRKSVVER